MTNDDPRKALLVVLGVAFACSVLVSVSVVLLQPLQQRNQLVERSRNVIALTGLVEGGSTLPADEILSVVEQLDVRVIDIDTGRFAPEIDPLDYDARRAAEDMDSSVVIPAGLDSARLGRRARHAVVYLVWQNDRLDRVILPINGQGMWSMLYGFVALEGDLNTIAAARFYEQAETPGLGDRIREPQWLAGWEGRRLYNSRGEFSFRVGPGAAPAGSPAASHQVDGLSGATVTGDAVTQLMAYWFGPHGYAPFLERLRSDPPAPEVPR